MRPEQWYWGDREGERPAWPKKRLFEGGRKGEREVRVMFPPPPPLPACRCQRPGCPCHVCVSQYSLSMSWGRTHTDGITASSFLFSALTCIRQGEVDEGPVNTSHFAKQRKKLLTIGTVTWDHNSFSCPLCASHQPQSEMPHSHRARFSMPILARPFQSEHLRRPRCNSSQGTWTPEPWHSCMWKPLGLLPTAHKEGLTSARSSAMSAWWPRAGPLPLIAVTYQHQCDVNCTQVHTCLSGVCPVPLLTV